MNKKYLRILFFYTLAIGLSNIFRFNLLELNNQIDEWPFWFAVPAKTLLESSGVLLGALIGLRLLARRKKLTISLRGNFPLRSLLIAIVPVLALSINGIINPHGSAHLYGLLVGISTLGYCLAEEYGWRAYLEEEFSNLQHWKRYILTGFLWYFWHLSFLQTNSLLHNFFFLAILIAGSFGLGQLMKYSRSVLVCAAFHMLINILGANQLIPLSGQSKLIILAGCLTLFIVILKISKRPTVTV